ncbi:MAG: DUF1501 domain-containing protein [Phycisphaerales bacterium]|nr:DUF1501 domain-containing protein [Phycisphaerales bacterium]
MNDETIHTRREFLHKGLTLVSANATVPFFLDRTAWAIADPFDTPLVRSKPGANDDRVLVVLQLAGGNDGLNTIIPYQNDLYYKARPRLGIAKNKVLKINDELGFHPKADGLKKLYDDGLLAVIQGVGYPNPNRSHFLSTDIWSTADPDRRAHEGWLGRFFDCTCTGAGRPDPKLGISLTTEAPLAMTGGRFSPVSFGRPEDLSWKGPAASGAGLEAFEKLNTAEHSEVANQDQQVNEAGALAYLERMAMDARASAQEIQRGTGAKIRRGRGRGRKRDMPRSRRGGGQLGQQLAMVKRMIAAGLETKVYYVSMGGFDTHAGQTGRHQNLLQQLGEALTGFVEELKEDGLLDRVTLMTFSEFGRRVSENGSQGTDHGAAAPLFVLGNRIRPGCQGDHPSLEPEQLDGGDLKWHTDFRSVYAAVLSDWLKADTGKILGGRFKKLNLFK